MATHEHDGRKRARDLLTKAGYSAGGHLHREKRAIGKAVHEHETAMHPGKKKTHIKLKHGGHAEGRAMGGRPDRKPRSGKGKTVVNVLNLPHPGGMPGGGAPMAAAPPMPPPGAMPGGPPGGPGGGPPRPPMPVKKGGRAKKLAFGGISGPATGQDGTGIMRMPPPGGPGSALGGGGVNPNTVMGVQPGAAGSAAGGGGPAPGTVMGVNPAANSAAWDARAPGSPPAWFHGMDSRPPGTVMGAQPPGGPAIGGSVNPGTVMGMPPGGPALGGGINPGTVMGMPPGSPMTGPFGPGGSVTPRLQAKRGGSVKKRKGGGKTYPIDDGAGGGEGRIEKAKAYGART